GASRAFADTYATAPGGTVQLGSDHGNVNVSSEALVDVSGATAPNGIGGDAGKLVINVPQGLFNQGGTIKGGAASGQKQGNFTLDTLGSGGSFDVSSLNLGAEGFRGAVSIRDRSDSALEVSGNVRAKSFELSSDLGSILVNGTIDTSGTTASPGGGAISLWSRGELTLNSSAVLTAAAVRPASGAS